MEGNNVQKVYTALTMCSGFTQCWEDGDDSRTLRVLTAPLLVIYGGVNNFRTVVAPAVSR